MTSLINFLNSLDTDKYEVDVMFYENGEDRCGIKEEINILPCGKVHEKYGIVNVLRKALSPGYVLSFVRAEYYKKVKHNKLKAVQIMSKQGYKYSRPIEKSYDIAAAYEFNWCLNYVTNRVRAEKKILWNHVEYGKSGMDFAVDKKALDRADALVFVSENCRRSYMENHPEHREKSYFIPNILSSEYVRGRGEEYEAKLPFENEDKYLKLLTVARVRFAAKGHDRAVRVFARLKSDGLLKNVKWVIVGDGSDLENLEQMIKEFELEDVIYTVGSKDNPIPYLKKSDVFFLPSIHEGKPMAVTESLIMGVVPVVTEYTSAKEQIKNGTDGLVFENNEQAIYSGLAKLLENPAVLNELKENILKSDYGNEKEIAAFDKLAGELLR